MWVGFMLVAVLTWPSLSSNVFAALTCNEKRKEKNYCSCSRVGFRSFRPWADRNKVAIV